MNRKKTVLSLIAKLFVFTFLMALLLEAPTCASAQVQLADREKVEADFLKLSPYLSMDGEIWLEMLDTAKIAGKVSRVHQYAHYSFDSHPVLAKVGRSHMSFLIQQESRVIPTLRAKELNVEAIFVELLSRYVENQVVLQWQLEADRTHRANYAEIMPIVRQLSAEPQAGQWAQVEIGARQVSAKHELKESLENATLVVGFEDWTGERVSAYYFVPKWDSETSYNFRLPIEASSFGSRGIVKVSMDIYSEKKSAEDFSAFSRENLQAAVDAAVERASQLVRYDPAAALDLLKSARGQFPTAVDVPDQRIRELQTTAKATARQQYARLRQEAQTLRSQIRIQESQQRRSKNQRPNMLAQMQLSNGKSRLEQIEAQIDRLKDVR